jgi:hypothetical protein
MPSSHEADSAGERIPGARFAVGDRVLLLRADTLYAGAVVRINETDNRFAGSYAVRVPALGEEATVHEAGLYPDDGATPAVRVAEQVAAQRVLEVLKSRDCRALPRRIRRQIEDLLRREITGKYSTDPQAPE